MAEISATAMAFAVLRVWIGTVFVAHGLEKLFGAFGGQGRVAWRASVERQGYRPIGLYLLLVPLGELAFGPLLALGLGTPVAAAFLSVELVAAIKKIHLPKGFFNFAGGWEFQGTLLVALIGLGLGGPGPVSLDERLGISLGPIAFIVVFVLGIAAAAPGLLTPNTAPTGRWIGKAP